jgi:hypothetical protein
MVTEGKSFQMDDRIVAVQKAQHGFTLRQTRVELPLDNSRLDTETQLDLLICHLFSNEKRSIWAIMRLGFDRRGVFGTLLEVRRYL